MFQNTVALCNTFLKMGIPGLDLVIYKDGQQVLRHTDGFSDREKGVKMAGNEKLNIFSCSKPLTCVAAMQLWEKGLFHLEDHLADYMPEFSQMYVRSEDGRVNAQKDIRIHHLFEMTAGLNYNLHTPALDALRKDTNGRCPTREVARAIAESPLDFEPGTRYQYSLCHDVLAALVEVISGEKFETYVKKHIFDPLGMVDSSFLPPMDAYEDIAPLYRGSADGVVRNPDGNVPAYRMGTEHASGGAGCASTVDDYIKFAESLRVGDIILGKDTIRLMTTNRLADSQKGNYGTNGNGYGLGLRTGGGDKNARYDFGWGGAAGAFLAVDPIHNISLFYAQHVLAAPNMALRQMLYSAALEDLEGIVPPSKTVDPSLNNLTY